MKIDLGAVHADIGDHTSRRDDLLAQLECSRYPHRFDRCVDAAPIRQGEHRFRRFTAGAVHG